MNRDDPQEFRLNVSGNPEPSMTEAGWLTAKAPHPLLHFIREKANARKLRLLGVACCRKFVSLLTPYATEALDIAEGYADGWEKRSVLVAAGQEVRHDPGFDVWLRPSGPSMAAQAVGAVCQPGVLYDPVSVFNWLPGDPHQADLLRDIFGSPFRPVAFDAAWRTDTAVSIARGMYESRDFSPMPILADALQDAGCENDDVLDHCRDPQQVHVRGCWVVDLVLGKS